MTEKRPGTRPLETARIKARARRRSRAETVTFFGCVAILAGTLGGTTWTYRSWDLEAKATAEAAHPADPARFDSATIAVPNREGSCDRISFNNRTGAMSYGGKMDCNEPRMAETAPRRVPAAAKGFANSTGR